MQLRAIIMENTNFKLKVSTIHGAGDFLSLVIKDYEFLILSYNKNHTKALIALTPT